MKDKIKVMLEHSGGNWDYHGHLIYDIQDEDGIQIFRVGIYIKGYEESLRIFAAILKVDAPLPNGITSSDYIKIVSTLEEQGHLEVIPLENNHTPEDYVIFGKPEHYHISPLPDQPGYEEEITKWLKKYLVDNVFLNKIRTMIKSVRGESTSAKK